MNRSRGWLVRNDTASICHQMAVTERLARIPASVRATRTKRSTIGTLSAALVVGLMFGGAEGCVSPSMDLASTTPEPEAQSEVEEPPEPEAQPEVEEPGEPERPPPWSPPDEPLLGGVEGAGQLLAKGDPSGALARLEELGKLDTAAGEADLVPESREWFLAGAVAGRAYMQTSQWQLAVLSLEPLAASKRFDDMLPPDIVGYELARARVRWAVEGGLDSTTADLQLGKAVSELNSLERHKPNRIRAAIQAAKGEALAAIPGEGKSKRKRAAKRAQVALDRLISNFPNHPEVGEWMLQRALTHERMGEESLAVEALRRVHIERAGEPEAERAWAEIKRFAREHDKIDPPEPLTTRERLEAGQAARVLRRLDRSAELLESVWEDEEQPRYIRREAGHSLGWTYYKAREFDSCVEVLGELYEQVPSIQTRKDLTRCLERGERYDEGIDLWLEVYDDSRRAYGATALWNAIELAYNGGRYERAIELLDKFEDRYKARGSERRWLRAWLPMRTGDDAAARAAFAKMLDTRRTGGRERAIRYFLGKLELRSDDPDLRAQGVQRLYDLAEEGMARIVANGVIGGHPIYYGLMARQRLIEAGEEPPSVPKPPPLDWESRWIGHGETLELLGRMAEGYGEEFSSLIRAEQLFAAGWREEASREVRMAADEFINGRAVYEGSSMPGTRSEALVGGLAWAAEWRHPRANPGRDARRAMRDEETREAMRADFMELAWAMHEPYRFGKLTNWEEYAYRTRWHLRAYREPIERHAWQREIDPHHLWALMYTESRFRRHVVSWVGARGALQIMPWTGRQLVERLGEIESGERFDPDILFNIEDNSRLATYYISELLAKFYGQPTFAYASYNGGPSNVARWLGAKGNSTRGVELDEFVEEIPFSETAGYARRVMEVRATYDLIYKGELPVWSNEVDARYADNIGF